ncbi:MAG: DUF1850 domain-containing protein [Negativicutes bacterium]
MKRVCNSPLIIGIVSVFVGIFLFFKWPLHTILKVENVKEDKWVFCASVHEGEEFILSFVHSFNRRPVFDTIRVEGDHLLIVKSRYDSFGAGMPETSAGDLQLRIADDGWLELTGINRSMKDITMFAGTVANHSLRIRDKEFPLIDMVRPGTSVKFSMGKISTYDYLKGRCTPWVTK